MMNINNESYFIKQKIALPIVFIFLVLVSLAAYFSSLHNDFIFEDRLLIAENPYIKDLRFIGRIFKTDIFHFHPNEPGGFYKYYRPLQSLSYSLDYFLWKLNPAGFRLTNILIHGSNSFLLFLLIALIFKDNILALLSALIFCLHPIHVLNVAYLSPRSSLLETLFMFSSLVAFFRYYLYKQRVYYPLSLFLFILAVLSREAALLLPLFILTCAFSLGSTDKKKMALSLIPYFILAAFYLLLRSRFIPCEKLNITAANLWQRIAVFLWLLQKYLTQLLLPIGLQVSFFGQRYAYAFLLFLLSSLVLVYSLISVFIFKNKIIIFAVLLYFISLLPAVNLVDSINIVGNQLAEHYLYLAAAAFSVLSAYLLLALSKRFLMAARVITFTILLIFISLVVTISANYKNNITFYKYLLGIDWQNNLIRANLASTYYERKEYAQAIKQADATLAIEPDAWDAYFVLGNIFREKGELSKAEEFYKKTIFLNPGLSLAFNNLALLYKEKGEDKKAHENFEKALSLDPESVLIMNNFADFLIKEKKYPQVFILCARILDLEPYNVSVRVKLGVSLAESGRIQEAEKLFQEALRINPYSSEALRNFGVFYGNTGDFDKAIALWQKALSLNPSDKAIRDNLDEAKRLKKKALK